MIAREAAYLALLTSLRQENFIINSLGQWMRESQPSKLDFAFAYEVASGSARMALALDYIGAQLSTNKKLSLKLKEKALLRTAIYQYCYMEKVPLYAIVNETIELAKKYCHKTFVGYLNALLRKLEEKQYALPTGNTAHDMSVRYSYPLYFIEALIADYGKEIAQEILAAGNIPPKTMVRVRPGIDLSLEAFKFLNLQKETGLPVAIVDKAASLAALADQPEIYIQNATPVALVASLSEHTQPPTKILDLCASPGGKLLAAHDLYPEAKLFANDVSQEKLLRLSQNLKKYGVQVDLTCGKGEDFITEERFDLIILDVPCSNSGVLNKRPEARWRLSKEAIEGLKKTQWRLIEHSLNLLSKGGVIWYMTCSILKEENEKMLEKVCRHFNLQMTFSREILPNKEGWDGGFAVLLTPNRKV